MSYLPQRPRKNLDIALLLKVCPHCLGDLVFLSDFSGEYYRCLQCRQRTDPVGRIGRLPELAAERSLPGTAGLTPEALLG